jgi:hypothetical protein
VLHLMPDFLTFFSILDFQFYYKLYQNIMSHESLVNGIMDPLFRSDASINKFKLQ